MTVVFDRNARAGTTDFGRRTPDLKIWCMKIVSEGLLFIYIFFFSHWEILKTFTGVHILSRNICFGDASLQ